MVSKGGVNREGYVRLKSEWVRVQLRRKGDRYLNTYVEARGDPAALELISGP